MAAFWLWPATARGDDSKATGQVPSGAQQKIKELEDRFKGLHQKVAELRRKHERQLDAVRSLNSKREPADGPELDRFEAERVNQVGELARASFEWLQGFDKLNRLHYRLSQLKQLQKLETEIKRLEQQKKEKSDAIQRLDDEWNLKRSELLKYIVASRVAEIAPANAMNPGQRLRAEVREELRKLGKEPKKDDQEIREAAEIFRETKERASAFRTEARRLWERAASVRDDKLEIEASTELARMQKKHIEESRGEWDRDEGLEN